MKILNKELIDTIRMLRKSASEMKAPIWREAAEALSKPRSRRVTVNVSRINRYTKEGETILVPGKVLGAGKLDHPVTVAAFSFSKSAKIKISEAGGKAITIPELIEANPKGSNVRLMG